MGSTYRRVGLLRSPQTVIEVDKSKANILVTFPDQFASRLKLNPSGFQGVGAPGAYLLSTDDRGPPAISRIA